VYHFQQAETLFPFTCVRKSDHKFFGTLLNAYIVTILYVFFNEIMRIMQTEETVLDRTEARKLRWFVHVMRMPEERWPAIIHSWIPQGRRKGGRPRRSWRDSIPEAMEKRGMGEEDAQDRILWRRGLGRRRTAV
jgi:hypothetical protein